MDINNNTVLITGGGSGIGLALAVKLLRMGNAVIICGRNKSRLERAKLENPSLHFIVCDITKGEDRDHLVRFIEKQFPNLNILINNAAVQIYINLTSADVNNKDTQLQIETNLIAPINLIGRMLSVLLANKNPAIVNITSDLAYVPMAIAPVYCATKAAMHSFTLSLRHQLRGSQIKVFEVFPPVTNTELDNLKTKKAEPEYVARKIISGFSKDKLEIRVGQAKLIYLMSRLYPKLMFYILNEVVDRSRNEFINK